MSHERYETLLMRAVDGVIGDDEQGELDEHIETCAECREELTDFRDIKAATDAMTARILQDARIEPPRETPAARASISVAFLAILSGVLLLLGFAGWTFATDPNVPPVVKIGAALCSLGGLVLLGYTLMLRYRARRGRDPYQEIDR